MAPCRLRQNKPAAVQSQVPRSHLRLQVGDLQASRGQGPAGVRELPPSAEKELLAPRSRCVFLAGGPKSPSRG